MALKTPGFYWKELIPSCKLFENSHVCTQVLFDAKGHLLQTTDTYMGPWIQYCNKPSSIVAQTDGLPPSHLVVDEGMDLAEMHRIFWYEKYRFHKRNLLIFFPQ